jgi:hypothetical protein
VPAQFEVIFAINKEIHFGIEFGFPICKFYPFIFFNVKQNEISISSWKSFSRG